MSERQRFPGLSSAAFEHSTGRAALAVLRKAPVLDCLSGLVRTWKMQK